MVLKYSAEGEGLACRGVGLYSTRLPEHYLWRVYKTMDMFCVSVYFLAWLGFFHR